MDDRLVAWARAVKSRQAQAGRRPGALARGDVWRGPVLWLFTDAVRTPDVLAAVRGLPRGLCGVVFRHDGAAGRADLGWRVWQVCRSRRLAMVVAGSGLRFRGPGRHWRGGWPAGCGTTQGGLRTASAHGWAELVRARRHGAMPVFLSAAFPTASHVGAPALGVVRWAGLARHERRRVMALGGIDGAGAIRLPRWVVGAGAIGALLPT